MRLRHPTVVEERWLVLALRYPALRVLAETPERTGGWRTSTLRSRCLFFLLGVFGASMAAGSVALLPSPLLWGGALLIVAAEFLIGRRLAFRSGIEEALYVCGALALAGQIAQWSSLSDSRAIFLFASALGLAGLRVGSFPFTTLAVLAASIAVGLRNETLAAWLCGVAAAGALVLASREATRPSYDRMSDGLLVTLPLAASVWTLVDDARFAVLVPASFALVWTLVGARRRSHPHLIGALLLVPCVAVAFHEQVATALEWHLMGWGVLAMAGAGVADRFWRRARKGFTSRNLGEMHGVLDLLEVSAVSTLTPAATPAASPGFEGDGGSFGGGGASGRF